MENSKDVFRSRLDNDELLRISGGNIWGGLIGALIYDVLSNHEKLAEGFREGYEVGQEL